MKVLRSDTRLDQKAHDHENLPQNTAKAFILKGFCGKIKR